MIIKKERKILAIIIALITFVSTVHINSYAARNTDAQQFVVGDGPLTTGKRYNYPISIPKKQNVYYLAGKNLMNYPSKISGTSYIKKIFSKH